MQKFVIFTQRFLSFHEQSVAKGDYCVEVTKLVKLRSFLFTRNRNTSIQVECDSDFFTWCDSIAIKVHVFTLICVHYSIETKLNKV